MTVEGTPGNMDTAELRRERKRQTDRMAQRQHRKRQKQYIEELEAQIALLKTPGPSETSQLATQNIRLQDELKQMHSLWDEMESILQRQRELRQRSIISQPPIASQGCASPIDDVNRDNDAGSQAFIADSLHTKNDVSNRLAPHQEPNTTHEASEPIGLSGLEDLMLHESTTASHMPGALSQDADLDLDTNFDMLATHDEKQSTPASECPDQPSTMTAQTNCPRSHAETRALTQSPRRSKRATGFTPCEHDQSAEVSIENEPSWEDYANSRQPDALDGFMELFGAYMEHCIPALGPTIWPIHEAPRTQHLPMFLSPPLPRDRPLHNIIERASKNPAAIGPPTLVDFLFDNPTNTLSVDLKKYLAPVQKVRRTSEFLATYWVLYLFLRWQILRTDEAYQSLPPWFRPTPLQLTVLHPVTADLIAWPEIREGLIHMSLADSEVLQEVSTDVGKYLTVDIPVAEHDLLNDPQQIASQILNLANWKLDTKFFDRYPQWKSIASAG
ncbi:hypothetical protein MRS44_007076 [Fusarium solani]|uniref:uncharacterized protein n=1 Tax=Fusarium solani TaxID=169388 RepID=UPI0032C4997E|nr:hypothetical protein MRS44_007076 [Fusarium solani]